MLFVDETVMADLNKRANDGANHMFQKPVGIHMNPQHVVLSGER